jgi:MYXO-CTERM domain-containing protein
VTFYDGAVAIGSATLDAGVATFSTAALTKGSHSLTAVYGGDAGFQASTSAAVTHVVSADGGGGCNCNSSSGSGLPSAFLTLLAVMFLRSRRKRAQT